MLMDIIRLRTSPFLDEKAFSLFELLAVLLIVSFLVAASLPRFEELTEKNIRMAVFGGLSELNCRETMVWANEKLNQAGWRSDGELFKKLDKDLGKDFIWKDKDPGPDGGCIIFQNRNDFILIRQASTNESPGRWFVHGK
jgi:hypothetical protein